MRYRIIDISEQEHEICYHVQGIRSVLDMLASGREATPRSWLYEDLTPEEIRREVLQIIHQAIKDPRFEFIIRKEEEYDKFKPQGGVPPFNEEIREIILNSYTLCHLPRPMYKRSVWDEACKRVIENLGLHGQLTPWTFDQVLNKMKTKGTSDRFAAWPTGGNKDDEDVYQKACDLARDGRWREAVSLILMRSYRDKLRRVDMMPWCVTLKELSFVDPILELLQQTKPHQTTPLQGFDVVKSAMYKEGYNFPPGMVFGGDSTKMDDHFGIECTEQVFNVLKHAFPQSYWDEFHELCQFMHKIPRIISYNKEVTENGEKKKILVCKKIVGEHGLASGSGFTNLFETIHDMIVLEVAKILSPNIVQNTMEIGDDYIVSVSRKGKYSKFFVDLFESCGLPGNLDKQSDDYYTFEFLQRIGIKGYVNDKDKYVRMIYLIMSAMRSGVYPENFIEPELFNSDMFCCKIAQIVENCVDHPAFEPWCRWIAKGQKDIIAFAKQKRSKIDAIWRKALRVRGVRESYNNEKQNKPLSTFKCIEIWSRM